MMDTRATISKDFENVLGLSCRITNPRESVPMEDLYGEYKDYDESRDLFAVNYFTTAREIETFCCSLAMNKSLARISLDGSLLGVIGAEALGKAIKENDKMTTLSLANMLKSSNEMALIATALEENISIVELNLSESKQLGVIGCRYLSNMLKVNRHLCALDLSYSLTVGSEMDIFAQGLKSNSSLVTLELKGCRIMNRSRLRGSPLKSLADAIKMHKTLKSIGLSQVVVSIADAHEIGSAIMESKIVESVDVSDMQADVSCARVLINSVRDKGENFSFIADEQDLILLSRIRRRHKALQELRSHNDNFDVNITDCIHSNDEFDEFIKVLKQHNQGQVSLNLQDNDLSPKAVAIFMDTLSTSKSLSSLNLASSLKTTEAVGVLANALRNNEGIKFLSIMRCPVGANEINSFRESLMVNTTLIKIRGLTEDAASVFEPYFNVNKAIAGVIDVPEDILFTCFQIGLYVTSHVSNLFRLCLSFYL